MVGPEAYTVFPLWSRLVELSTCYTTADRVLEIATVDYTGQSINGSYTLDYRKMLDTVIQASKKAPWQHQQQQQQQRERAELQSVPVQNTAR